MNIIIRIFTGDFNIFFNASLEAPGGYVKLKTRTVAKFLELKGKVDLCDIWSTKHPKTKTFTFRQIFLVLSSEDWIIF